LEIINYRRAKNLIASREAIPSEVFFMNEHSNYFIKTLQTVAIHPRLVATSEIKCKN